MLPNLLLKKPEAKTEVATTAAAKKQEIEQDGALSPEAKKKLQDEVDAVKKASEEAIDGAKKMPMLLKLRNQQKQRLKPSTLLVYQRTR